MKSPLARLGRFLLSAILARLFQAISRRRFVLALALPLLGAPALAADGVVVDQARSQPAIAGGTGLVVLTIRNLAAVSDALVAASSPDAAMVSLHRTERSGGMAGMVHLPALEIPAGGSVTLSPDGAHLMLHGLRAALRPGGTVRVVLRFERAGPVEATAEVRGFGR